MKGNAEVLANFKKLIQGMIKADEIRNLASAIVFNKNICSLDITVNQILLVQKFDSEH